MQSNSLMAFSMFDLYSLPPTRSLNVKGPYEYSKHKRTLNSTPSDSFRVPATPSLPLPTESPSHPTELGPYQHISRDTGQGSTIKVVRRKEMQPVRTEAVLQLPQLQPLRRRQSKAFARSLKWTGELSHSYMENRRFLESINKKAELKKTRGKRRKLPLNRTTELSFESKPAFEEVKKEAQSKLKRSTTMMDVVETDIAVKKELDFVHRRVSQQISSVKAEIQVKIASYVKHARLSYLQTKGLRADKGHSLLY